MNNTISLLQNNDFKVISDDMETCVVCKSTTNVRKNTHIDHRYNYVDGVGQLCEKCSKALEKSYYEQSR